MPDYDASLPTESSSSSYGDKHELFYRISEDLEAYLEQRFPTRYVRFTFSSGTSSREAGLPNYSVIPTARGQEFTLQLMNMSNGEIDLELALKKKPILQPNGEWTLTSESKDTPVLFARRFIEEYLSAEDKDRKIETIARRVLKNGDVVLTVDAAFEGWCTHPRGILFLRADGVYLNHEKIRDGELGRSTPHSLEVIPSGIVFESVEGPEDLMRIIHRDFNGKETVLWAGYRSEVQSWRPHPEGVALDMGDEVRVNGRSCIFRGSLPEVWGVTSSGRVVTVSLNEHRNRELPGGKGYFRPAGYAEMRLEGGGCLYEAKYQWLESGAGQWHPHADIRLTGYGIFVKDSPEWRFFERFEDWEWQSGMGLRQDQVFADEWSFFEVLSEGDLQTGGHRGRYQPESARLLWRPGTEGLFDWRPSIEGGSTRGIIVREGSSFVFHSGEQPVRNGRNDSGLH